MSGEILKIARFQYFLANGRKYLSKEVLGVFGIDDCLKRLRVQMLEKVNKFFEDGQCLILEWD